MSILAIINPASGGGKKDSDIVKMKHSLKNVARQVVLTEYPGHATEIVKSNKSADIIAVAGGDGTLFECLNGMNGNGQIIAPIPAGTGNSLARNLGIRNWDFCVTNCISGGRREIDTIRIHYKDKNGQHTDIRCLATAGIGYPANSVILGNNRFKKMKRFCYPIAGLIQSVRQNNILGSALLDNREMDMTGVTGILINNAQYVGNFRAFPNADVSDGLINIMIMTVGAIRQNIQNLLVLLENYHYMPNHSYQAKKFIVKTEFPISLMVDGEIIPEVVEAEFRIEPRSVNCLAPGGYFPND